MITATEEQQGDVEVAELKPIWPEGIEIEVLGVTGDYEAGKTLFVNTIDPPNTRSYDFEKSSGTYAASLGIERIDVPKVMLAKYPDGYKPIDVFRWWIDDIRSIKPGTFTVINVDTIGDIEAGLADYVASQYKDYGFSSAETFKKMKGVFWGQVKEYWKMTLADLAARCQTFAFTTHLRAVWKGDRPTSQREPKGKTTLMELATLFLWLERDKPKKGDRNQQRNEDGTPKGGPPSADVLKSRLAKIVYDADAGEVDTRAVLPPRIPVATPAMIRKYIVNPPNYYNLKPAEKIVPKEMSPEEKLVIESEIAENKRIAEESALERLNRMAEIGKRQADEVQSVANRPPKIEKPVVADKPVSDDKPTVVDTALPTKDANTNGDLMNTEQTCALVELVEKSGTTMKRFLTVVEKLTGEPDATKLTIEQGRELARRMEKAIAKKA
jgi:hypothetical protein